MTTCVFYITLTQSKLDIQSQLQIKSDLVFCHFITPEVML